MEEVGEGRPTVSVWDVWKDVKASGRGEEGLVIGGGVVVERGRKVVEELVSSSITRFSIGLGRSLASGPLPCTRSRSIGSLCGLFVGDEIYQKEKSTWL